MIDRMGHHLRAASCLTEPEERNVFLELEYAAVKDWNVVARTPTALKDQLLLLFDVQCLRRILELRHPSEGKALDFVKQVVKENRRYAESVGYPSLLLILDFLTMLPPDVLLFS